MLQQTVREIRNMRDLVQEFINFRVTIRFKNGKVRYFYGQEWSCTLSQVLNRRVPHIEMNKEAGYVDLLNLVEKCKGRFHSAKIYSGKECTFTKLHRVYNNAGELEQCDDPVITDDKRIVLLHYKYDPATQSLSLEPLSKIDFKKEVENSLSTVQA